MVAGLFHLHGVWVGTSRGGNEKNPKGFFENKYLKKLFAKTWGLDLLSLSHNPPSFVPGLREKVEKIIQKDGYKGGPWLYKHSALYWRAWGEFDPKFILVRRDLEKTIQSNIDIKLHHGAWSPQQLRQIMQAHHAEMDLCGGVDVYTDDLIKGDYRSLEKALSFCGIEMNENIVNDFIEPRYWRH